MEARVWFTTAADGFLAVVDGIEPDRWERPGLGVWDVRSLLGHAARAFATLESYLRPGTTGDVALPAAVDYYRAVRSGLSDPAQVAERGRQAGEALGPEPRARVHDIAQRAQSLVRDCADDTLVETPVGAMTLRGYLPTRAFELTVHGIDLARATDQRIPTALVDAAVPAMDLGAAMASAEQRIELLLAMTGRTTLPEGFSVV
ncbi:maleylpyruvate isomerase N-terminal domain-containing protein [Raineyella fluvialis]|uniref:Mycothiol-dependent maleylpyruvate isomerase metal-binding domain-containing protein n=1 Tax=Raineyella fluvialis TaxID=2662261 RepID=A0A5Q2FGD2_9ACTN|nr:maleylpyruvate isomerase N-terminal domain-containing protein [Raineyella fluvialis]QGF24584.1 hypothetical protein Rai3103_14140 [Raineyella fluvialis]